MGWGEKKKNVVPIQFPSSLQIFPTLMPLQSLCFFAPMQLTNFSLALLIIASLIPPGASSHYARLSAPICHLTLNYILHTEQEQYCFLHLPRSQTRRIWDTIKGAFLDCIFIYFLYTKLQGVVSLT